MKTAKKRTKKAYDTLVVFLLCFAFYFICNTYSK
jgi:hypothetical protein